MKNRSAKKGKSKIVVVFVLIVLGLLAGAGYVYTAPEFEREVPRVYSEQNVFWNRKDPLKVELTDNEGLKSFELILSDGKNSLIVGQGTFEEKTKKQTLLVKYPTSKTLDPKATKLTLKALVTDSSMWNFSKGNKSEQVIDINVDFTRPNVNVIANSYSITQGGSALVVFQAEDENLDTLYIEAGEQKFKAQPYKKEGYYVALIAWPFTDKDFKAKVVAIDAAKNQRTVDIPFYLKNHEYKVSWIQAKDKFIDGKITDLASSNPEYANIDDRLEKLKAINEAMRLKNEDLIHSLSKDVSSDILDSWKVKKFYPLKNGQKVASYGDERHYYYEHKDNEVSHSYHVGYDLASTKMATIKTSNAGKVVYANENGIYGNMPMIDHGLGLYSLYGHCSQLLVNEGDEVNAGDAIAKTGVSGLALGDHLHFGILVQGIEVRPVEWFDQEWIRKNVDDIFKAADKIIQGK
ncbi:peptidoglycan DD-metalloendopeptidase family protein [Sulfurovum sp.]|uniref:peptidoglycan DD-metalloendopeptidase family protein n=1 Tax=Sulfurovum sp. TaxID=1969726 RepID=UPI0035658E5A